MATLRARPPDQVRLRADRRALKHHCIRLQFLVQRPELARKPSWDPAVKPHLSELSIVRPELPQIGQEDVLVVRLRNDRLAWDASGRADLPACANCNMLSSETHGR